MMLKARYALKETFPIAMTKLFGNTRREHTLFEHDLSRKPVPTFRDHALNFRRTAPAKKSGPARAAPPLACACGPRRRYFIRRTVGWPLDTHHRQYHDGCGSPQAIK
jgi:hypothetical protein